MGLAIRHLFPKFGELWSGVPRYHMATCNSLSLMHLLCNRGSVFSAVCDFFVCFFLFVTRISPEPLNGFSPKSQGWRWSLAWTSFECQGHRDKNVLSTPVSPQQRMNGMCSLQTTCSRSRQHHSVPAGGGVISGLACSLFGRISFPVVFTFCFFS